MKTLHFTIRFRRHISHLPQGEWLMMIQKQCSYTSWWCRHPITSSSRSYSDEIYFHMFYFDSWWNSLFFMYSVIIPEIPPSPNNTPPCTVQRTKPQIMPRQLPIKPENKFKPEIKLKPQMYRKPVAVVSSMKEPLYERISIDQTEQTGPSKELQTKLTSYYSYCDPPDNEVTNPFYSPHSSPQTAHKSDCASRISNGSRFSRSATLIPNLVRSARKSSKISYEYPKCEIELTKTNSRSHSMRASLSAMTANRQGYLELSEDFREQSGLYIGLRKHEMEPRWNCNVDDRPSLEVVSALPHVMQ